MDWLALLVAGFGGGLIVKGYEVWVNRGKILLNESYIKVNYLNINRGLINFDLDLQFINKSGYQKVIHNIQANFFDGQKVIPLLFFNFNTQPADIILPKSIKCLKYKLNANNQIFIPIPERDNNSQLEISYKIDSKDYLLKINLKDMAFNEVDMTLM
jgi:hypothetical protein